MKKHIKLSFMDCERYETNQANSIQTSIILNLKYFTELQIKETFE